MTKMSVAEYARIHRITAQSVRERLQRGTLKGKKYGKIWVVDTDEWSEHIIYKNDEYLCTVSSVVAAHYIAIALSTYYTDNTFTIVKQGSSTSAIYRLGTLVEEEKGMLF